MVGIGAEHALRCAVQPAAFEAAAPGTPRSDGSSVVEEASRTVYFARVPPCVPESEIHELFSRCGPVSNLQLFRPWSKARTSKGCGLVEYATPEAAQEALTQLNDTRHWPEAFSPLLVERRDAAKGNGRTKKGKGLARGLLAQGRLPPSAATSLAAASAARSGRSSPFALGNIFPSDAECDIGNSSSTSSTVTSSASNTSSGRPDEPLQLRVTPIYSTGHALDVIPVAQGLGLSRPTTWPTLAPGDSATQGGLSSTQQQQQQQQQQHLGVQQGLLFQPTTSAAHAGPTSGGIMQPAHAALQLSALTLCEAVTGGGSLLPPGAGMQVAPAAAPFGDSRGAGDWSAFMPEGQCSGAPWVAHLQPGAAEAAVTNPACGSSNAPAALLLPLLQASPAGTPYSCPDSGMSAMSSQGMPVASAPGLMADMPPCTTSAAAACVPVHLEENWPQPSALVGEVSLECQHRMLLKLTRQQAVMVAQHAEVLGRVTGSHVSFTVSTDGAAVLCVEGSSAQVIQAQSLVLLLL